MAGAKREHVLERIAGATEIHGLRGAEQFALAVEREAIDQWNHVDRAGMIVELDGTVVGQRCAGRHGAAQQKHALGREPARQFNLALVRNEAVDRRVALERYGARHKLVPHIRFARGPIPAVRQAITKIHSQGWPRVDAPDAQPGEGPFRDPIVDFDADFLALQLGDIPRAFLQRIVGGCLGLLQSRALLRVDQGNVVLAAFPTCTVVAADRETNRIRVQLERR